LPTRGRKEGRRSRSDQRNSVAAVFTRWYPNSIFQERIGYLLKRPVGRPCRSHASFTYQGGSWTKPRWVVAKGEWRPGELYPRVGTQAENFKRMISRAWRIATLSAGIGRSLGLPKARP
jgi:hypothetical protein